MRRLMQHLKNAPSAIWQHLRNAPSAIWQRLTHLGNTLSAKRFGLVLALYIIMILWASRANHFHNLPSRDYIATRKLLHNHRMRPDDLAKPTCFACSLGFYLTDRKLLEGTYVIPAVINSGQSVRATDLWPLPALHAAAKTRLVVFPLATEPQLAHLLDVGMPVALLGSDPDAKQPVSKAAVVHAVGCQLAEKNTELCYAILQVAEVDEEFVSKNKTALRLLLAP